jgi:hypothetical protein
MPINRVRDQAGFRRLAGFGAAAAFAGDGPGFGSRLAASGFQMS